MNKIPEYEKAYTALQKKQIIPPETDEFILDVEDLICTFDVQYLGEEAYLAMEVRKWGDQSTQIYLCKEPCTVAYQPGYFSFREGPILLAGLERLQKAIGNSPKLLIIDGHGTAHPRRLGIASWVGIHAGIPAMGIAKEPLVKKDYQELGEAANAQFKLIHEGQWIGTVLRSQKGIKPIFISAGHLINQTAAVNIAIQVKGEYRIPEPIRMADQAARAFSKGESQAHTHLHS